MAFRDAALDNIADLAADACFLSIKDTMPQNKNDLAAFSKWYDDNPLNDFDAVYADCQDEIHEKIALYIRQNIAYFGD
ncbi:MAG: hypothetical protein LBL66_00210 [Clostridiales bacterium]|jgi:hypothetical protein|nr:hypothetical protein [Clostridiales bacterium]